MSIKLPNTLPVNDTLSPRMAYWRVFWIVMLEPEFGQSADGWKVKGEGGTTSRTLRSEQNLVFPDQYHKLETAHRYQGIVKALRFRLRNNHKHRVYVLKGKVFLVLVGKSTMLSLVLASPVPSTPEGRHLQWLASSQTKVSSQGTPHLLENMNPDKENAADSSSNPAIPTINPSKSHPSR